MNNNRLTRVNDEIKKELSEIIRSELKDPRVSLIATVLKVDTTNDLKFCKAYISVLGDDGQKEEVIKVLKGAAGFIRTQIAHRINLRNTPEFKFILDDSLEEGMRISKIIDDINK